MIIEDYIYDYILSLIIIIRYEIHVYTVTYDLYIIIYNYI